MEDFVEIHVCKLCDTSTVRTTDVRDLYVSFMQDIHVHSYVFVKTTGKCTWPAACGIPGGGTATATLLTRAKTRNGGKKRK